MKNKANSRLASPAIMNRFFSSSDKSSQLSYRVVNEECSISRSHANMTINEDQSQNTAGMSIDDMKQALLNPHLSQRDKQKLRKKLKKKKQREKKKINNINSKVVSSSSGMINRILSPNRKQQQQQQRQSIFLSDDELERFLKDNAEALQTQSLSSSIPHRRRPVHNDSQNVSTSSSSSKRDSHPLTCRILPNSPDIITCNFTDGNDDETTRRNAALDTTFHKLATARHVPNDNDALNAPYWNAIATMERAEVTFLVRADVSEDEIADNVSAALHVPWEWKEEERRGNDGSTVTTRQRQWCCDLSLNRCVVVDDGDGIGGRGTSRGRAWSYVSTKKKTSTARRHETIASTVFQITQRDDDDVRGNEKGALEELVRLVSTNLCGSISDVIAANARRQKNCLPFSQFSVTFPVRSTVVVLAFLESRLPGVMFFSYKRDGGNPSLDPVVFGQYRSRICCHPFAMTSNDNAVAAAAAAAAAGDSNTSVATNNNNSNTGAASCLVGFDLRLVKEFAFCPIPGEDSAASFQLPNTGGDGVSDWWSARHSIYSRVNSFIGIDPAVAANGIGGLPMILHPRVATGACQTSCLSSGGASEEHDTTDCCDEEIVASAECDESHVEGNESTIGSITTSATNNGTEMSKIAASSQVSLSSAASATTAEECQTDQMAAAIAKATATPDLKDLDTLCAARSVVVDLGNACWIHKHFSEDIQTRQYRSPEVLIGSKYDTSADIWSLGCMAFELLTGDLLFDPHAGDDYDRDEDHLAMFHELLGQMPKKLALSGKHSKKFFNKKGELKYLQQPLNLWPMNEVLHEKYNFSVADAKEIADFILPLLEYDPKDRATALDCLNSNWLRDDNDNVRQR